MADDAWQLEAISEQFNVLDTMTTTCQKIPSTDFHKLLISVTNITNFHLKMQAKNTKNPRVISGEIIKHSDGDEIKFSFVVIVMNIKFNGSLSKAPIFVITSGGQKKFIDMNLTMFNSWDAFLKNNNLPSCQFCFPVNGQYSSRSRLKIDFASSSAAIKGKISFFWKGLGFFVAVGVVVGSYFFEIPPFDHNQSDSLLSIANEYVPGIREWGSYVLRGISLVQRLRNGDDILHLLPDFYRLLTQLNSTFGETVSSMFQRVCATLRKIYNWLKEKLSSFFKSASETAKRQFMAVTCRVDTDIIAVDSEADELLEASRDPRVTVNAAVIHDQVNTENDSGYVNSIFKNARTESALEGGMKSKSNENLHPVTMDLLEISNSLALKLNKTTLTEAQDIFEALSEIVKEEFKSKIKMYNKMKTAATAGAGHKIDLNAFNKTLGIKGDPKEHYWMEACETAMQSRLIHSMKWSLEKLESQRKILILKLNENPEDDVSGLYRCVGVSGAGKIAANDLINALREIEVDLNEEMLVVNETSSMIIIRDEDLTISISQELNSEKTSESMILINRNEA